MTVGHYLFNFASPKASRREQAAAFLRARLWGVDAAERHRDALAAGDLALIYLAAPDREFIGRAELASPVHDWSPSEAAVYPGESTSGVSLTQIDEWNPPVPMAPVLAKIDRSEGARGDFDVGIVRITAGEFETVLAVAAVERSANPS